MELTDLKSYQLFSHLDEGELGVVKSLLKKKSYLDGEVIIQERESNDCLYLITQGEVGVYRRYQDKRDHLIRTLSSGSYFGEISVFHEELSHVTVKCHGPVEVYCLPHNYFEKVMEKSDTKTSILFKLASNVATKLAFNDNLLLQKAEKRMQMSWFLMLNITLMTGLSYFLSISKSFNITESNATFFTTPMLIVIFLAYLVFMYNTRLSFEDFGVTLKNTKQSVIDGVVFSLHILFFLTALKLYLIKFHVGVELVGDNFFVFPEKRVLIYLLFIPMQEFLVRGVMQTTLERLLTGAYKVPLSILLSNLVFSAFHSHLSIYFSLASLLIGLYWGWLYQRTYNLIGVCISHILIGIYMLDILDLDKIFKLVG